MFHIFPGNGWISERTQDGSGSSSKVVHVPEKVAFIPLWHFAGAIKIHIRENTGRKIPSKSKILYFFPQPSSSWSQLIIPSFIEPVARISTLHEDGTQAEWHIAGFGAAAPDRGSD